MMNKIPLHIFISCRTHYRDTLQELEELFGKYNQNPEGRFNITLRASETELTKGDSIVQFMDKIAGAGFVMLMLSADYFVSPYCLHELLEITRKGCVEERLFALPAKFADDVNHIIKDDIVQQVFHRKYEIRKTGETGWIQARLIELQADTLRKFGIDPADTTAAHASIKESLDQAFEQSVQPLIDNVEPTVSRPEELLEILIEKATAVFDEEKKSFNNRLIDEITLLLKEVDSQDKQALQRELGQGFDTDKQVAQCLVRKDSKDALTIMQRWVNNRTKKVPDQDAWKRFFYQIEQICGWLLLKSVNETWWIHNRLYFSNDCQEKGHVALGLDRPAYAEVVISRELMKAAEFCLDSSHDAIPVRFDAIWDGFPQQDNINMSFEDGFVIDANDKARAEELLTPLIFDLKKKPSSINSTPGKLLEELILEVKIAHTLQKVYYVVSDHYLQRLNTAQVNERSILEQINEQLGDKLVFVSYGRHQEEGMGICLDERELLTQFASILRINKAHS